MSPKDYFFTQASIFSAAIFIMADWMLPAMLFAFAYAILGVCFGVGEKIASK